MIALATPFLTALALSLGFTPLCRAAARRLGCVAEPKEDRWHRKPTALFGGIAIVAAAVITTAALGRVPPNLGELVACGVALSVVGVADDVVGLKPSTKLVAQIVVASALLFFGFRLHWTESMIGDAMLTLFWIVGVTNALNLLDNMDGLCGGITLIAGVFLLAALARNPGSAEAATYLAAVLGATGGFLVYNVHPASIFMGDAGSLFLGFNLAALTLVDVPDHNRSGVLSVMAAPLLLLLIPIFDTTLVTAMRLLAGRRPSQGGRDHSSHRLVAIGLSERRAVTILWMLAAIGGLISLLLQQREQIWAPIVAATFVIAMIIFAVYLARIRVYKDGEQALLEGAATPLVANFVYKRRIAEILLDLCLVPLAYYTAYRLRFEGRLFGPNYPMFLQSLPIILASQMMALFAVGAYRGTWRHFGLMDAVVFAKGVLGGTVVAELAILYLYRFENYSRSVFVIYAALVLLLLAISRASFRLIGEFAHRRQTFGRRCVIYGTAGASVAMIHEAFGAIPLKIIGFVDDNPMNRHLRVGGYAVLGAYDALLGILASGQADCVVVNTRIVDVDRLRQLEAACRDADIELLRLHVNLEPINAAS